MQKSKCPKLQTANLPSNKGTPRQLNDGFLPQYPAITVCLYNDFITGGVWWNYEDDYGDKKEELFITLLIYYTARRYTIITCKFRNK